MGNAEYMGSPAKSSSLQTFNMMKSVAIVALCLLAAVSAEAEADPYYGYYGHHLGYGYGHVGHAYGHGYHYGKREAEAEPTAAAEAAPEADAYYHHGYYGYPHVYGGYYGYHH